MKELGRAFLPSKPSRVLVLGSGALQIGQAGEFDYSGSQAVKALKQEGVYTVLLNPNIATVQTSEGFADRTYFMPITPDVVREIFVRERIDGLLLAFGGQTGLNCGMALEDLGILAHCGVRVLGTPISSIRASEDRKVFIEKLLEIGVYTAKSRTTESPEAALAAARDIGLPIILRAGFSLGGKGSAVVRTEQQLEPAVRRAFAGGHQILVEEYLAGWKEIEYEVVRDADDNCITVCNMENVNPMGIHTGDSIVVAPVQTLDDSDVQLLRDVSIKVARHLGIVGECNVQFALSPRSREYRVIEVNARLSRSSALASKATGYPLAYVAAKIALGYSLPQIANAITRTTTAFFEPALDYLVCKVPRWDLDKFDNVNPRLGPEMKSVGEVMAVGRSFAECIQKALRMLEIGVNGLDPRAFEFGNLEQELEQPTPKRIFAVARALEESLPPERVHALTGIDPFFVAEIGQIVSGWRTLHAAKGQADLWGGLRQWKRAGFSDKAIARALGVVEADVRVSRKAKGIAPALAQIDTLAAEYPAETNYLYFTYAASERDIVPSQQPKILVLGSGCYRIGSSVEFDWCSVSAVRAAKELGYETVLLNCNPETVSTDYDVCDLLVFDEISIETVLELVDAVRVDAVMVSFGGQAPNTLAVGLQESGVKVLGTPVDSIDAAEEWAAFFEPVRQAAGRSARNWAEISQLSDLKKVVAELGGYPVLVRPSYVLSGAAMRVAHREEELHHFLTKATKVSPIHPVVLTKFERHAREIEFDAVADNGEVTLWAISEHVEDAGVHSGDATLLLPPQNLYLETINQVRRIGARLAAALKVTGPFNVQLLSRHEEVKVIECNLRASRSLPFVSKAIGTDFVREATRLMLGASRSVGLHPNPLDLGYVAAKASQFSFRRLGGADPILKVEMASTGEVGCFGATADEALLKALLATGFRLPKRGVLLSLGPVGDKYRFTEEAMALSRRGLQLYATPGTAGILQVEGVPCKVLSKEDSTDFAPSAAALLRSGEIDLVINVPREYDELGRPDGYAIRRTAINLEIPLITDLRLAQKTVWAMVRCPQERLLVRAREDYMADRMLDRRGKP